MGCIGLLVGRLQLRAIGVFCKKLAQLRLLMLVYYTCVVPVAAQIALIAAKAGTSLSTQNVLMASLASSRILNVVLSCKS